MKIARGALRAIEAPGRACHVSAMSGIVLLRARLLAAAQLCLIALAFACAGGRIETAAADRPDMVQPVQVSAALALPQKALPAGKAVASAGHGKGSVAAGAAPLLPRVRFVRAAQSLRAGLAVHPAGDRALPEPRAPPSLSLAVL